MFKDQFKIPVCLSNIENCVGCNSCADACPCGVLKLDEASGKMTIADISACCDCQSCNVCPAGVISYN